MNKTNLYTMAADPHYTWLIDLDDTLYAKDKSIMPVIDERIEYYLSYKCRCSLSSAKIMRQNIFKTYANTFIGAVRENIITKEEMVEFNKFCHSFDLGNYIVPNKPLIDLIESIKGDKYIFTNSFFDNAVRILEILKIDSLFKEIISIEKLEYNSKPNIKAFRIALDKLKISVKKTILIDDMEANLSTGKVLNLNVLNVSEFLKYD